MHSLTLIVPSSSMQNSTGPATAGRGFVRIALVLTWFALSPIARAVDPPPDGDYPNGNTAEGVYALLNLTSGLYNTAVVAGTLEDNTTGNYNTATGGLALYSNR